MKPRDWWAQLVMRQVLGQCKGLSAPAALSTRVRQEKNCPDLSQFHSNICWQGDKTMDRRQFQHWKDLPFYWGFGLPVTTSSTFAVMHSSSQNKKNYKGATFIIIKWSETEFFHTALQVLIIMKKLNELELENAVQGWVLFLINTFSSTEMIQLSNQQQIVIENGATSSGKCWISIAMKSYTWVATSLTPRLRTWKFRKICCSEFLVLKVLFSNKNGFKSA